MQIRSNLTVLAVLGCVGFALGFLAVQSLTLPTLPASDSPTPHDGIKPRSVRPEQTLSIMEQTRHWLNADAPHSERARELFRIAEHADGSERDKMFELVHSRKTGLDAVATFFRDALGKPTEPNALTMEGREALRDWAKRDPDAAFTYALNEHRRTSVSGGAQSVLFHVVQTKPTHARRLLDSLQDLDLKHALAETLINGVLRETPDQYRELLKAYPGHAELIYRDALTNWARIDPAGALQEFEGAPMPDPHTLTERILNGWAANSPQSAAEWAEENGHILGVYSVENWAQSDPQAALSHVGKSMNGRKSLEAVSLAVGQWLKQEDPGEVYKWVAENLEGAPRTAAFRHLVHVLAPPHLGRIPGSRSEAYPDWFSNVVLELGQHPNRNVRSGIMRLVQQSRNKAQIRNWILQHPEPLHTGLIGYMLDDWVKTDSDAAADYVRSLPTARARALTLSPKLSSKIKPWIRANFDDETIRLIPAWRFIRG